MRTLLLLIGIFLLTGLSSCEKRFLDYRNKFTGSYKLTVDYSYWQMGQGEYDSGTFEYNGRIWYEKSDDEKDRMYLQYGDQDYQKITMTVSKDGLITPICSGSSTGKFEGKKKFAMTYSSSCAGGAMGGGANYTISGVKK